MKACARRAARPDSCFLRGPDSERPAAAARAPAVGAARPASALRRRRDLALPSAPGDPVLRAAQGAAAGQCRSSKRRQNDPPHKCQACRLLGNRRNNGVRQQRGVSSLPPLAPDARPPVSRSRTWRPCSVLAVCGGSPARCRSACGARATAGLRGDGGAPPCHTRPTRSRAASRPGGAAAPPDRPPGRPPASPHRRPPAPRRSGCRRRCASGAAAGAPAPRARLQCAHSLRPVARAGTRGARCACARARLPR